MMSCTCCLIVPGRLSSLVRHGSQHASHSALRTFCSSSRFAFAADACTAIFGSALAFHAVTYDLSENAESGRIALEMEGRLAIGQRDSQKKMAFRWAKAMFVTPLLPFELQPFRYLGEP
jgi:hypothetical protein